MSSLVPEHAVAELEGHLGEVFGRLPETARLALITAQVEGTVSHGRLREICADHPADLSKLLGGLVRDGLLQSEGSGRGMVYRLPWRRGVAAPLFDASDEGELPPELGAIPPELGALYLDWADVPPPLQACLTVLALPVSEHPRVKPDMLRATVLELCEGRYLGRRVLAHLLQRNPDDLLKRTLNPMVEAGHLLPAFAAGSDPRQAYTAARNTTGAPD